MSRRKKLPPGLVHPRKSRKGKKRRGKPYLFYEEMGRVIVNPNPNLVDRVKVE